MFSQKNKIIISYIYIYIFYLSYFKISNFTRTIFYSHIYLNIAKLFLLPYIYELAFLYIYELQVFIVFMFVICSHALSIIINIFSLLYQEIAVEYIWNILDQMARKCISFRDRARPYYVMLHCNFCYFVIKSFISIFL
jgi:hypothetical protein